ncbi:MAG: hypothetical protein JWL97_4004 [Gemmatimonadales bacterium]|nr:hypothetical protein [Gemmatimonadales bacterium]
MFSSLSTQGTLPSPAVNVYSDHTSFLVLPVTASPQALRRPESRDTPVTGGDRHGDTLGALVTMSFAIVWPPPVDRSQ